MAVAGAIGDFDDGCGDVCARNGGYWVRFFDDLVYGGWTEVGYGSVVYGGWGDDGGNTRRVIAGADGGGSCCDDIIGGLDGWDGGNGDGSRCCTYEGHNCYLRRF